MCPKTYHIIAASVIVLALTASARAQQQRDPRDGIDKSTGHTVTDSDGTTTVYDEHGRVIRRSTKDKDGAGHVFDPDGRRLLTITPKVERR
jgi:hypothetical protein